MRFGEVALDLRPLIRRLGQEVDMHLIGAELRTLMAEMGKVERAKPVGGCSRNSSGGAWQPPKVSAQIKVAKKNTKMR